MARGDLVEKKNGKWVFLLDADGTESQEFDSKAEAEAGLAAFLALVADGKEQEAIAAEEAAKAEAEADYQRRLRNFNAMKGQGPQVR
ncbi:hypothetical protein ASE82_17615 [Sphingomonas sp. Leaf230]|uniref:hypothetical protein n=1 Tax=Sphingomonas sp. Leaf230 TaxID=1735694 RepID=UPI0006F733FD|nr:hypothetical protein [Sphingomonas sp. Leaf230]KQN00172.1 hypothetical protein ASE82_17615 [Sphingomonas sp. Leaf230]